MIAGCGQRRLLADTKLSEPNVPMVQIWRLDDWQQLYESIYTFSDTGWYASLGDSLASENQELLIGVLGGDRGEGSPTWNQDDDPGYCYLFETVRPHHGKIHRYLKDLNWFSALVSSGVVTTTHWERAWTALQITAAPSTISILWRIRGDIGTIDPTIAQIESSARYGGRYREMVDCLRSVERSSYYPIFSERIAQLIKEGGPKRAEIVPTPQPLFNVA
jgi:hypothetical protein